MSFARLNRRLRTLRKDFNTNSDLTFRRLITQSLTNVILTTPVDTGRARANWQISLGSPAISQLANEDPGGGGTIAAGTAKASQATTENIVFLSNNLPYIVALDNGSSPQAPAGFVEASVRAAIQSVLSNARLLS